MPATLPARVAGAPSAALALVALALVLPRAAAAQRFPTTGAPAPVERLGPGTRDGEPRFLFGGSFAAAQPVHEFRGHVREGYGGSAHGVYRLGASGALGMRLDLGFVTYGRERKRVPIIQNVGRVTADLTTTNNIFWAGIGPQLMVPSGPFRPYVTGSVGVAAFTTTSSLEDRETNQQFLSDRNQSDASLATSGAAGVLIPLARGARSLVMLDVGARYHNNGDVTYLTKGGVRDLPGGGVEYDTIRSRANLWTWHLGVSIGAR